ncbi:hypothetical protein SAMN04488498_102120 [Mesorhizobium albiziae]|uniref:Uncharacterized protein n=1 Tax=Neomesorhizobium albiziae TaxID=335020 RepID=A0A1I3WD74_9HYPH|nr:hypothetical protein [Mesorhizobium albiziae]GLS31523.1 hypothetical protein GCM10007937_32330 [Mesorhizobium albiziae]SFK05149.1 hypothetical protein SAMN04488498_102120 [Mesorhizobium albiziae]
MNKILNHAKMYVIGDRDSGIVMIKTNPVKIVRISRKAIEDYGQARKMSYDEVFGMLASRTKKIADLGKVSGASMPDDDAFFDSLGMAIAAGTTISEADFCFVADVDNDLYQSIRSRVEPIKGALAKLEGATPELEEALLD